MFRLWEGSTLLASDSTLGDADGVLDFGGVPLDVNSTNTICEYGIPVANQSHRMGDGDAVDPDNPELPEDYGTR